MTMTIGLTFQRPQAKPEDVTVTRARGRNRVRVSVPYNMRWPNHGDLQVAVANSEICRKRGAGPLQTIRCERVISSSESEYSYVTVDEHRWEAGLR